MTDVLISYSRKDKQFVHDLHAALVKLNRDTWVDWEDIPLTADWWKQIQQGIEAANTFVFVVTPDSVRSAVCRQEIEYASVNNKRLVPILRREITEADDKAAIHPAISSHNWIYFIDDASFDTSFASLVEALDTDLNHVQDHTRLLVRAHEWENKGRDSSFLLRGAEIREAESWLEAGVGKKPLPGALHAEYIGASRRAANRRQRSLLSGALFAVVISLALAVVALFQSQAASNNAATAVAQAETAVAAQATSARRGDEAQSFLWANAAQEALRRNARYLAVALALEANRFVQPPPLAQQVLAAAAYPPGIQRVYRGHGQPVSVVAVSPDGKTMLSGSIDSSLKLWNLETGAEVYRVRHQHYVFGAAFSPDGTTFLSASADSTLILWNAADGEMIRQFKEDGSYFTSVAFSPDGQRAVSGTRGGTHGGSIILWDVAKGKQIWRLGATLGDIYSVAYSPDGRTVLSGSSSGEIILWNVNDGREIQRYIGHTGSVTSVVYNPNGQTVLSGGDDGLVILWDVATGTEIRRFVGHSSGVTGVAFSPDGRTAVSGSGDTTIILWDVETGNEIERLNGAEYSNMVQSVAFSTDGQSIFSGMQDGRVLQWDMAAGDLIHTMIGHSGAVNDAAFSSDGRLAISGNSDGTVILWDVATGEIAHRLRGHTDAVTAVTFSPDGKLAMSASDDKTLVLWDVQTGQLIRRFIGHTDSIKSATFSPDGRTAFSTDTGRRLIVWDVATGQPIRYVEDRGAPIVASSDPNQIFTTSSDGMLLWNVQTGVVLRHFEGFADFIAYNAASQLVLTRSSDETLKLWDAVSGVAIRSFGESVQLAAYSPDGRSLLTGSTDGTLTLWDMQTGQEVRTLRGHQGSISSVVFSPNGHLAMSSSADGTVKLWRVDTLVELISWTYEQRIVPALTCLERQTYNVQPACDQSGAAPTVTPYITWTPSPTILPMATSDPAQRTATPTLTATIATPTSTPTPNITRRPATAGEWHSEIPVGRPEVWAYDGKAGETLRISAVPDIGGVRFGLRLAMRAPYGVIVREIELMTYRTSDPEFEITLPEDGAYEIEVGNAKWDRRADYTLIIESSLVPTATPTDSGG